ncbi:hypothetical protein [Marinobacter salicampi]|uniref:hypothetical protein n=1 Tax=Marinobacter salicampi TaxID=435907 RepID=UPI00140E7C4B|nr:hypothetical protein [Marinobacter salicampi]
MDSYLALKALAVWFGIVILAIANGVFREVVLIPFIGSPGGLMLSGVLLSSFILGITYLTLPWFGRLPVSGYLAIGLGWLCLTLAFEFGFGRLVQGKPWPELFEAYRFTGGNIWPIVLLVTALSPSIAARLREWC